MEILTNILHEEGMQPWKEVLWFKNKNKQNSDRHAAAAAKSLQSCPTLCDPIDGNPLSSSVPGILQARTLEWVAISFSNAWKGKVKVKSLSHAWLLATPWTAAHQAPPSMGFSRQEYWGGLPLPSPSLIMREGQIEPLWDSTSHLLEWLPLNRKKKNKSWQGCGDIGALVQYWWWCKMIQLTLKIKHGVSSKNLK